jgi:hypothetical protein
MNVMFSKKRLEAGKTQIRLRRMPGRWKHQINHQ